LGPVAAQWNGTGPWARFLAFFKFWFIFFEIVCAL
jgi:hypothetical protein